MSAHDLPQFILASGGLAGAFIAIFYFVRLTFRGLKAFFKKVDDIEKVLRHELHPNSGSSMKDQLNRLEEWTVSHQEVHESRQFQCGDCKSLTDEDFEVPG